MNRSTATATLGGVVVVALIMWWATRGASVEPIHATPTREVVTTAPGQPTAPPALPSIESTGSAPQDANPGGALIRPQTVMSLRSATSAGVRRCLAELRTRQPTAKGQVGITFELEAHAGVVRVTSVSAHGDASDAELSTCVDAAAHELALPPAADQPDGDGRVTTMYSASE